MTAKPTSVWRYWEDSNLLVAIVAPIGTAACLWDYDLVRTYVRPLAIDSDILLSYSLNLFAIALGALVSLFALLASKPTEFLTRIRATATFMRLITNIKITMLFCSAVVVINFVFGVLKLAPANELNLPTALFVLWSGFSVAAAAFYVRTIRLVFLALT